MDELHMLYMNIITYPCSNPAVCFLLISVSKRDLFLFQSIPFSFSSSGHAHDFYYYCNCPSSFNSILKLWWIGYKRGSQHTCMYTVYPKKYAHGFVVLCFVVVMQSFIMNSHEVFIHIHQGCFAGTGAIVRLPQCQWSKPDGYGKISQCVTTTKHSKAKTVCIFLGIYCTIVA